MTAPTSPDRPSGLSVARSSADPFWTAARNSTVGYTLIAELGRASGAVAILARVPDGTLVAIRVESTGGPTIESTRPPAVALTGAPAPDPTAYRVTEHRELDIRLPAPASRCQVCSATLTAWRAACSVCGHRPGATNTPAPPESDLLAALRSSGGAEHRMIGSLPCGGGDLPIWFAEETSGGSIYALRLSVREQPSGAASYAMEALPLGREPGAFAAGEPTVALTSAPDAPGADVELVCLECGGRYGGNVKFCPKDGSGLQRPAKGSGLVGQTIDDRYYVESRLGQGGMGEVYLAKQIRTGRRCALKLMHRSLTSDDEAIGRFRREAASACAVSHPNIATVYDYGETREGVPYFAMEYVEGRSLASVLEAEGALPPVRALDIARQIAEALAAAHELTIVHRDLKPDNVMLAVARGGVDLVKVVDFGIAKATNAGADKITRTGFVIGTVAYMSPEQIRGDLLDGRTDLYSLGCLLYEMLTGQAVYPAATSEMVMVQRLTEDAPRVHTVAPELPASLDELVARMLARSPDERVQTAHQLSERLLTELVAAEASGAKGASTSRPRIGAGGSARTPSTARESIVINRVDTTVALASGRATPPPLSPPVSMPSRTVPAKKVDEAKLSVAPASPRSRGMVFAGLAAAVVVIGVVGVMSLGGDPGPEPGESPNAGGATGAAAAPAGAASAQNQPVTPTPPAGADSAQPGVARPSSEGAARPDPAPAGGRRANAPPADSARAARNPQASASNAPGATTPTSGAQAPPPVVAPPVVAAPPPTVVESIRPTPPDPVTTAPPARPSTTTADSAAEVALRAERQRVQSVVESYVRAIAARDLATMRALYPAMPQGDQDGMRLMFRDASDFTAQMLSVASVSLTGDAAEAQFTYAMRGRHRSGVAFDQRRNVRAVLARAPGGWTIRQIQAVR